METQEEMKVQYFARHVKGYKVYIGKDLCIAVNGILTVTLGQAAELDKMMKTRGDLRQNLQKIDSTVDEAAIERQRQILLARQNKGPAAVKGAVTSAAVSREKLRTNDAEVRTVPAVTDADLGKYRELPITGERGDPGLTHPMDAKVETPTKVQEQPAKVTEAKPSPFSTLKAGAAKSK